MVQKLTGQAKTADIKITFHLIPSFILLYQKLLRNLRYLFNIHYQSLYHIASYHKEKVYKPLNPCSAPGRLLIDRLQRFRLYSLSAPVSAH